MLHAVILAGGSGTRFWPLSRKGRPKQFLALAGERTLLQQTFDRLEGLVSAERVHCVTSAALAGGVREQLPAIAANVIAEPVPRDTAIAIGLAAGVIRAQDEEAVLAVLPADAAIRPAERFRAALSQAAEIARAGKLVTFGIPATTPHTGYGYIRRGEPLAHGGDLPAFVAEAFEEKPSREVAEGYVAGGRHSWNSGMFVWTADAVLEGLRAHQPKIHAAVERMVSAWGTAEAEAALAKAYAGVERLSIDYAVLEHATNLAVLEADFEWSDVGSWSALPGLFGRDEDGNTVRDATCVALEASNCVVQGDGGLIALVGVENLVVVQTPDAILVCHTDRAQDVKAVVERLRATGLGERT